MRKPSEKYIPIKKYKYTVITESDPILHEYYITRTRKNMIYKVGTTQKMLTSYKKNPRELVKRRQVGNEILLIRSLHKKSLIINGRVHFVPTVGNWTCRCRGFRKQPKEYIK